MSFASKAAKAQEDKGLYAEYVMTEALLDIMNPKPSRQKRIQKLLEARKLCDSAYGEFSILMSRIYHNLGNFLSKP